MDRPNVKPEERRDWEVVQENVNENDKTERLRIVGGFLYRVCNTSGTALVFVPAKSDE